MWVTGHEAHFSWVPQKASNPQLLRSAKWTVLCEWASHCRKSGLNLVPRPQKSLWSWGELNFSGGSRIFVVGVVALIISIWLSVLSILFSSAAAVCFTVRFSVWDFTQVALWDGKKALDRQTDVAHVVSGGCNNIAARKGDSKSSHWTISTTVMRLKKRSGH